MESTNSNKNLAEHQKTKTAVSSDKKNNAHDLEWNQFINDENNIDTAISPQDVLDSWMRFRKKTYLEWKKFINGANDIDTAIIPPDILESWMRCRERKLNPLGEPQNIILPDNLLQKRLDDNRGFIKTSQPFFHQIFQSMKATGISVGLLDRDGVLLQVIQNDKYKDINRKIKWSPGAIWAEEAGGTNSTSSLLIHKKPVQTFGSQHYMQFLHYISASSAPVFDPEGELIGCITLATFYYAMHPHTLGMAMAAAGAIENEMKLQKVFNKQRNAAFKATDIAQSLQKAIITSIPEALIAVDIEGRITSINKRAQKLFGLEDQDLTGQLLRVIFSDEENLAFLDLMDRPESLSDVEVSIRSSKGPGDYSLTYNSIFSSGGSVIGKILIFSEIQRIKSLVNKFIGAKANLKFSDIYGKNTNFKRIVEEARLISQSASNVLLLGESGTGKDILAQAIHNASQRKDGPYVAINCAAIPRDLIASELFGHEEGSFTGSRRGGSQGKFELADGGTIFLDEIAETPLEIQAVLLRVIEDKCFIRIGSNKIRTVDVRIISATNKNLIEEVSKGNFRKDLYYRLNVFNIHLPPLQERADDIRLLVDIFLKKHKSALGKTISSVDEKVWNIFLQYSWPGNVRELQNVVERMVNYASTDRLTADLIPAEIIGVHQTRHRKLDLESPEETEKKLISHLLTLKFRKTDIAKQLNMSRANLYLKLKKYGLTEFPKITAK